MAYLRHKKSAVRGHPMVPAPSCTSWQCNTVSSNCSILLERRQALHPAVP
jgi:hypothetical protein